MLRAATQNLILPGINAWNDIVIRLWFDLWAALSCNNAIVKQALGCLALATDCRMQTRALAKVNRDLCNNVVAAHRLSERSFYRLANNGGTQAVPNGRVTGRLCFSSIVINTCRAEAPGRNFFPPFIYP